MLGVSETTIDKDSNEIHCIENKNVSESSDESADGSDEENHEDLVDKIQRIKQKKQELINKLKLHEAVSQFKTSVHSKKRTFPATTAQKRKSVSKPKVAPRRKSLRLMNVAATFNKDDILQLEEEEKVKRMSGKELNLKDLVSNDDSDHSEAIEEEKLKKMFLDNLSDSFNKPCETKDSSSSFLMALKEMNKVGCVYRKIVDYRTYTLDIHGRSDFLLIAAGAKSGQIGLWRIDESVQPGQDKPGEVFNFPTYSRTVSKVLFPFSKPNDLYFSNYAGAVRSIDLGKMAFNQTIIDDEELDTSTFALQDLANNVVIAGCYNGNIVVHDTRCTSHVTSYQSHDRVVKSISVHPLHNHYFSTSSNDSLVKIFDFRHLNPKLKPVSYLTDHVKTVDSACFSPVTGNSLVTTSLDNTIRVYDTSDIAAPKLQSSISHNNNTGRWLSNFQAIWHPCREDIIAVGSLAPVPRQIDFYNNELKLVHLLNNEENLTTICSLLALHRSRHVVAGANSSGKVFLFES